MKSSQLINIQMPGVGGAGGVLHSAPMDCWWPQAKWLVVLVALSAFFTTGCGDSDPLVPVSGHVYYRGKPLEFGSVMLQPPTGPPASAVIQADGSFELEVPGLGKGVRPGTCRVRITCFEGQSPNAIRGPGGERELGKSLIPTHYSNYSDDLVVEIEPNRNEPLEIHLTD